MLAWRRAVARLYVAAMLCLYLGLWTWGLATPAIPEPNLSLDPLGAATLVLLGFGFIKLLVGFAINWWTPLPRKPG